MVKKKSDTCLTFVLVVKNTKVLFVFLFVIFPFLALANIIIGL